MIACVCACAQQTWIVAMSLWAAGVRRLRSLESGTSARRYALKLVAKLH